MRYCDHQFILITELSDTREHAIVVCNYCGQVRHVYETGKVVVIMEEGEIIKNKNGNSNPIIRK